MTAAAGLTDEQAVDIANRANIAWGNARTYYPSAIVIAIHEAYAAGAAAAMPREPVAWRWRAKGSTGAWRFDDGAMWNPTPADVGIEWEPLYAAPAVAQEEPK